MTLRGIRFRLADSRGVTLIEVLVVLLILGVILGGMTTLFVSASTSQVDQSNRYQAQHNARLALDNLRREIRCASSVTINSPSSVTVTLPGRCQKPTAATHCAPLRSPGARSAAPRRTRSGAPPARRAPGTPSVNERRVAESLFSNQLFSLNRRSPPGTFTLTPSKSGTEVVFSPRRYAYSVTAVVGGKELSGDVASIIVPTDTANRIRLDWSSYAGATEYRVYGRDDGALGATGLRYMATVTASDAHVHGRRSASRIRRFPASNRQHGRAATSNARHLARLRSDARQQQSALHAHRRHRPPQQLPGLR